MGSTASFIKLGTPSGVTIYEFKRRKGNEEECGVSESEGPPGNEERKKEKEKERERRKRNAAEGHRVQTAGDCAKKKGLTCRRGIFSLLQSHVRAVAMHEGRGKGGRESEKRAMKGGGKKRHRAVERRVRGALERWHGTHVHLRGSA
jgi:hypothetical protein